MRQPVHHQHCLGYFLRLATVSIVCGCVMEVESLQCERALSDCMAWTCCRRLLSSSSQACSNSAVLSLSQPSSSIIVSTLCFSTIYTCSGVHQKSQHAVNLHLTFHRLCTGAGLCNVHPGRSAATQSIFIFMPECRVVNQINRLEMK